MKKTLNDLKSEYYETFKGLPGNRPIVRNNQINDAFELVVLNVLYGKNLPAFTKENAITFSEYVIAPPDSGIDVFYQHENGDDYSFDVIQVKDSELSDSQLRNCITEMKRTIDDFCKDPKTIKSESCKDILSNSGLDKSNKKNCTFYVVHTGTVDDFSGSEENEKIITIKALNILYNNESKCVDQDTIHITDSMKYGNPDDNNGAIVCSLNGYDLAVLCKQYHNTEIGRNLLFGNNLRESLITKKSKPYLSMSKTIIECPENFWYYNNGITIIARDIIKSKQDDEKLVLKEFSIVNGAQTTSALGLFLKEARNDSTLINQLKKVFVLTRILKVPDEKMRQDIAIFNNTQNPITSRDMVSNRAEQEHLNEWLLDSNYPQIYVEIRRGSEVPSTFNKGFTHRKTTNEELAQVAYAYFLQRPFTAKDKKSALFNNDFTQSEYVINKIYHDIYNWDESNPDNNGLLFKKSKTEIDEALFVQLMYKESKKEMKSIFIKRLESLIEQRKKAGTSEEIQKYDDRITNTSLYLDTIGICMFYFLSLYYEFKVTFVSSEVKIFNYDKYYADKDFRTRLIKDAMSLFLTSTVKVLVKTAVENGKAANVNNWVRSQQCESKFFDALRDETATNLDLEQKYQEFRDAYMIDLV